MKAQLLLSKFVLRTSFEPLEPAVPETRYAWTSWFCDPTGFFFFLKYKQVISYDALCRKSSLMSLFRGRSLWR